VKDPIMKIFDLSIEEGRSIYDWILDDNHVVTS